MIFKIEFEADIQGLASVKRVTDFILVSAKDGAAARHYAEGYIAAAYSDTFAILGCVPQYVHGLE